MRTDGRRAEQPPSGFSGSISSAWTHERGDLPGRGPTQRARLEIRTVAPSGVPWTHRRSHAYTPAILLTATLWGCSTEKDDTASDGEVTCELIDTSKMAPFRMMRTRTPM